MDQIVINVAVSTVISALVGFIGASIKIGQYKNKIDTLENTVGHDEHGGLRKTLGEVRDKVIACEAVLNERGPLTKKKSPVSLTERGVAFLNNSGGKNFIDNNFNELLIKVDKKNPKTAYDIQEVSKETISSLEEDVRLNPLKEFLFKDGSPLTDLIEVMGIYLRDKILTHKNLNVEDIDTSIVVKE